MATGVGIVGCGNICGIYIENLSKFKGTRIVGLADQNLERARTVANKHGQTAFESVDAMLSDPNVEIVVNLTVPKAHASVSTSAIASGKHVYNEKPLAVDWEDGVNLVESAAQQGVRIGCAPDTFLGASVQTCGDIIKSGVIGEPVAVQAFMMCPGHESWHPDPEFYYEVGGGPMFDMGPYYLTALVATMGPIKSVTGMARATFPTRTISSEPKRGSAINVETPTHLTTVFQFQSGAIGQLTTSFDVQAHSLPHIEVYGSRGSLRFADPNGFGGEVRLRSGSSIEWTNVVLERPYTDNHRGLGVIDMALAIQGGRKHRATGELGLHVLEVMHAAHWSARDRRQIELTTTVEVPEPMSSVEL